MERRPQHAHGTRSAPIHGIAEDAIAPEASSTESDTLSTKLASERIPIPIESKPKSPMIEIIEAIDSSDEHDGGEHGTHATAPSVELSFDYSLDAAGDVVSHKVSHKAHEPSSSTPSARSSGATSTQSVTPEHLAAAQSAVIAAQNDQIAAAQEQIDELVAERRRLTTQKTNESALSTPPEPKSTPSSIEERFAELLRRHDDAVAENIRLSHICNKQLTSRRSSTSTAATARPHSAEKSARARSDGLTKSEHDAEIKDEAEWSDSDESESDHDDDDDSLEDERERPASPNTDGARNQTKTKAVTRGQTTKARATGLVPKKLTHAVLRDDGGKEGSEPLRTSALARRACRLPPFGL